MTTNGSTRKTKYIRLETRKALGEDVVGRNLRRDEFKDLVSNFEVSVLRMGELCVNGWRACE